MRCFNYAATAFGLISLVAIPREARAAQIAVTVGGAGGVVAYSPQFVNASVGDEIVFTFEQKNHTVTQSSLASPCSALDNGFDSGFVPVADNVTSGFPTRTLTVQDTNPIWVYCRQTGHCQKGMVFAVNPGDKFAAFQAAANASASSTTSLASLTSTPSVVTVTETVTATNGNVWTTTYGSYPGSAEPTTQSNTNHMVTVGGTDLVYNPSNITAQPGDTITFQFMVKNHTATQSSFNAPCEKLALSTGGQKTGFDSGFMPVSANATDTPTFTITVNDTAPIWVYCRQTGHCGSGMVFSVNAVEPNDFDAFKARAIAINGTNATSSSSASGSSSTSSGSSSGTSISYPTFSLGGMVIAVTSVAMSFLL